MAGLLVDGSGQLTDCGPVFRAYRAAHPATRVAPPPAADTGGAVVVDDAAVGTGPNQFSYTGVWRTSDGAGKYQGSDHYSSAAGATATVRFTSTGITLCGRDGRTVQTRTGGCLRAPPRGTRRVVRGARPDGGTVLGPAGP